MAYCDKCGNFDKSHVEDWNLKLHSNDTYWGKLPYFTEIEYICSNDPYSRYDKLLSGDVDLIFQPPHEKIKKLKKDYVLNELNGPDTIVMSINCNREYFNQNVRNAISYCIDREELINTVFLNHAILPKSILSIDLAEPTPILFINDITIVGLL